MLSLGQKVYIVADSFEQSLPVGEYGYIIAYDRNADNAFDYVVRIPAVNKHVFVSAADVKTEEKLLAQEAERIEKEALIDYALATKNKELFNRIMNGEIVEAAKEVSKEVMSQEEFIKQIHLKAWI